MEEKFQINIAICDDDPVMLTRLEELCRETLGEAYSLSFSFSQSAQECLRADQVFHIALLDVKLLEDSGIRLAQQIMQRNAACRILFVSGHVHVVSDVYAVPHFCFVLKDQMEEKLPPYLLQAAEMCAQDGGRILSVKTGKQIETILLSQIICLERRRHYTYITQENGEICKTLEKLSSLQCRMGPSNFVRCHISYVVNLRFAASIENRTLLLKNGTQIPISIPNEQQVRDCFFRYLEK